MFGDLAGGGGEDEESASGEDMKGCDSEDAGGGDLDEELARQAPRRKVAKPSAAGGAEGTADEGLLDLLAGAGPRKKRKA
eukprot:CAMPEP_0170344568 /NCGR_PEP_ID=MMETSP0116_2-20130129/73491_1 /TAXON_ID=400756 /ORGANISM="Durinskia baltica, Strain CSIRO CS-38" /LENGTH=79 /DNA_ID=CAMNT_0010598285 /DNA_START=1 /DNA_END=237 /DNA_ORIENTATION=+